MREEWRTVEENHNYEISDYGNVRHVERRERVLKPCRSHKGYMLVALSLNGVGKTRKVHRLVCAAFHGPAPDGQSHVDHINYDRADNRADNLRWVSRAENNAHSQHRQAQGVDNGSAKLTEADVLEIRRDPYHRGMDTAFAKRFGVSIRVIGKARRGETWRHINANT